MSEKPKNNPEPLPELKEEYERFEAIMRGNERLEQQIARGGKQIDDNFLIMLRINMALDHMLGRPEESKERLEFEIAWAEIVRTGLTQAQLGIK